MPEMVDASTLIDETRIRRGELAAAHNAALRIQDEAERKKELAKVERAIKAEYADDPQGESAESK